MSLVSTSHTLSQGTPDLDTGPIRSVGGCQHSPLAPPGDDDPRGAVLVDLLLHLGAEADGAHDAVAKLLVEDGLVRVAVVLDDLVQAVDERLDGGHGPGAAAVGEAHQRRGEDLLGQAQQVAELVDVARRGRRLAVEDGGDGDLAAAEVACDLLEGEVGLVLGGEELCETLVSEGARRETGGAPGLSSRRAEGIGRT